MARVTIPERVCPHCGGNEWYAGYFLHDGIKHPYYKCVVRAAEHDKGDKRSSKRSVEKITNGYIRRLLKHSARRVGTIIDFSQLTQEDYEMYREGLQIKRINKKLIKNEGNIMKTIEEQKAEKSVYNKKYNAMKRAEKKALNDVSMNQLTHESVSGKIKFYSDEQCRLLLSAYDEGKSHSEIARMYAKAWNRTEAGIVFKISGLLKGRNKAKPVSKPAVTTTVTYFEATLRNMLQEKTQQVEKLNEEIKAINVLLNN